MQTTDGKTTTPNGNNEVFPTTAIDEKQYDDGQACGTQQNTHLDQQTERPKTIPISSKEKGRQNSKKQEKRAGEVQRKSGLKRSSKGKRK